MKTPDRVLRLMRRAYLDQKLALFRERCTSQQWPRDTCNKCNRRQACCCDYNHHVGDVCVHCGNNELDDHEWLYRKME